MQANDLTEPLNIELGDRTRNDGYNQSISQMEDSNTQGLNQV